MSVSPAIVQRVKDASDILTIVGLYVALSGVKGLCPFHQEKTPSFFVYPETQSFYCFGCREGGDAIRFLQSVEGWTFREALTWLAERAGIDLPDDPGDGKARTAHRSQRCPGGPLAVPRERPEPIEPVPDRERLERLLIAARAGLEGPEAQPAIERRGIPAGTLRQYGVGFRQQLCFEKWPGWELGPAWLLPICRSDGEILGVKVHREDPADGPKAIWAPLGRKTDPRTAKARNGWATLWPPPEWALDAEDERAGLLEYCGGLSRAKAEALSGWRDTCLYLCPGELKALAVLGAGKKATAITGGESHRWTPGQIARLRTHRLVILFDDDEAGHRFRDTTIKALAGHVADLRAITFGTDTSE